MSTFTGLKVILNIPESGYVMPVLNGEFAGLHENESFNMKSQYFNIKMHKIY